MARMVQAPPVAPQVASAAFKSDPVTPSSPRTASSSEPAAHRSACRMDEIRRVADQGDLERLREMANEAGGYETDELRRIVWPLLLGSDVKGKRREGSVSLDQLPVRDDERQVQLDVARSLINYPRDVTETERDDLRLRLEKAILHVLRRHPSLQYFQGYHDIVSILLLTLDDDELLASATEQMSLHRIRDSMGPGLEPTLGYLKLSHRLIQRIDPEMYSLVNQAASMPFFALSWALTLFSHDLLEVAVIARLFDFLLAHNPAMISYLVVAILLTKKLDLVGCLAEEDNDPAMVHSVLSQLPNLVLPDPRLSRPATLSTPSSPTKPNLQEAADQSETESEALFSSKSASTSSISLDLDSTASSSTLDVSESLVSLSEASLASSSAFDPTFTALRQRRKVHRQDRLSFSSFDSDINALDDSMLSDPDIDNPAFAAFPSSTESAPLAPSTPPAGLTSPSSPGHGEFHRSPPRTVSVEDLVQSALDLWHAYPLVPHPHRPESSLASIDSSTEDGRAPSHRTEDSIRADTILGPNSCVFTYEASITGRLDDRSAEEICRIGTDIVHLDALLPDPVSDEDDDTDGDQDDEAEEDEVEDEDGFEFVGTTRAKGKNRNKKSRSTRRPLASSMNGGRINLGPHGWLVVGGVAVATAVAYGVYGARGAGGGGSTGPGFGLGTGGLGLRTGAGGLGGGAGPVLLPPPGAGGGTGTTEGVGGLLKGWAKGAAEL
ncbi:hypothetical protein JCM11491_006433 [Sporobolomyces phaffii]